ncbi:MAG: hypothetical protein ACFFER_00940 [Candidatus Thorarchaeota archaeon]
MKQVCKGIVIILAALILVSGLTADVASAEETPIVVRGNLVPIIARLLQNGTFGDPVVNQCLFFYDQTQDVFIGSALTDINGYATVSWNISINHPLGSSLLNVTFEGNISLSLSPSCQWSSVIVVSATVIEVQIDDDSIHPEDEAILTAKITDDHNASINGVPVAIYSEGNLLAVASTNGSGYATFIIDCNDTWCLIGYNTLRIVFEQDMVRFLNSSQRLVSVNIQQIATSIEIEEFYNSAVHLNDSFWLQVTIRAEGQNHSDASLVVFLDENPIDTIVSDMDGIATLSLDIDSRYILGIHSIKIEYSGTFRYASSSIELDISVISPATIHIELPDTIPVGVETEVQVTLYDLFMRPIPNATITLYDELTQELHLISFSFGKITALTQITFNGPLGPRNLHFEASHLFLTNKTRIIPVIIWSQPSIIIIYQSILGYASPSQVVTFQIQLNASGIHIPERPIAWQIGNHLVTTSITNNNGIAEAAFPISSVEGFYSLLIGYNGSTSNYELPTVLEYGITVSRVVPVSVNMVDYSVYPSLQEIAVQLSIIALNGTPLEDVNLYYEWLGQGSLTKSHESGIVEIGLRIPTESGVYNLYYETEESAFTQSSTGYHIIIISSTEAMAGQGVGIPFIVISLGVSVMLASIPVLWRRRLIG